MKKKKKKKKKKRNATVTTFFTTLLHQILSCRLLQVIIDGKKIISVIVSN